MAPELWVHRSLLADGAPASGVGAHSTRAEGRETTIRENSRNGVGLKIGFGICELPAP